MIIKLLIKKQQILNKNIISNKNKYNIQTIIINFHIFKHIKMAINLQYQTYNKSLILHKNHLKMFINIIKSNTRNWLVKNKNIINICKNKIKKLYI